MINSVKVNCYLYRIYMSFAKMLPLFPDSERRKIRVQRPESTGRQVFFDCHMMVAKPEEQAVAGTS